MKPESKADNDEAINQKSGIAYAAAFSLFVAVAVFLVVGWMLDRWLGTKPWLLVAGIVLGSAAGFYQFLRTTSKLS
ncbi:MAG: AtpZ/AtpI family protein [Pyrinomonadaceae bacterium]